MFRKKVCFYVVPIVLFVAYVAWILGPYVRSVIVRDAAVTARSYGAVAPIDGRIVPTFRWS